MTTLAVLLTAATLAALPPAPTWQTRPCPTEDSTGCYWDAQARGNHQGRSFYAIPTSHGTTIVYWNQEDQP